MTNRNSHPFPISTLVNHRFHSTKLKHSRSLSLWSVVFLVLFTLFFLNSLGLATCLDTLSVLCQVHFENIAISLEAQNLNWRKNVFSIDGLSFLIFAFFAGLAGDEGNELWDALLNSLFCIFCYFGIVRKCFFHDPSNVGDRKKSWVVGCVSEFQNKYLSPCLSPYYILQQIYNTWLIYLLKGG